jgi:transposase
MNETTRGSEYTIEEVLYLAFELSNTKWKLGLTVGPGQKPRKRTMEARDLRALREEIARAKRRFGLAADTAVKSCYEAGRDGFWLHRYLIAQGVQNVVVDSSSIEVKRRKRRTKTDGLDMEKLLSMLIRYDFGERKVWSVVNVPSMEAEDWRHLHRQLVKFKSDRTRHINRIKGILASQGVRMHIGVDFLERLEQVRLWDGSLLPPGLRSRLQREYACLRFVNQQILELKLERRELIETSNAPCVAKVRQLLRLRGIGAESSWLFVMEFFGWREFRNRREVGALAGLTGTLYQSGDSQQEQGISKAGNRWVRGMAIEIAWSWLRYQPESDLTHWYRKRFAQNGKRQRKVGIVALARKLLIELWRYLETGAIPAGAQLKP